MVAEAHKEGEKKNQPCSLNAAISSWTQLVGSYCCAVNISLNISEVALFQAALEALK